MTGEFVGEGLVRRTMRPTRWLLARLHENARRISLAYRTLSDLVARNEPVPAEAEWLLDTYYVIDGVVRQIPDHLPRGYYRQLAIAAQGPHAGLPRIYPLAASIVGCGEASITEGQIREAVQEYQQTTALSIGELWAVPTMLRLAVIELIRGLVDQMLETVIARQLAYDTFRGGRRLPVQPSDAFLVAAWEKLREAGSPDEAVHEWASEHLADPHAVCHREFSRQAGNQVSIGNAVTTLRLLSVLDWKLFFESTSLVEEALRTDPVYARQDFVTRDRCRGAVERFARRSRRPEVDVAQAAILAAGERPVAEVLLGESRVQFGRELGERRPWWRRLRAWFRHRPGIVFFTLLLGFTLALALPAILAAWPAAIVILIVASEIGVGLTHFAVRKIVSPRVLPKLDLRDGIPTDNAAFVVVPTLIANPEQAAPLLEKLEQHYLSNPDPALSFALLTDFTDAPTEIVPHDVECVDALKAGIASLNTTYCGTMTPRFFLFHRRRKFNESENCWMGFERKRGKLDEFNALLRGDAHTSFTVLSTPLAKLPQVKYVLTLDTDTVLPRDAAKQMIATLAHPLNRPRLSYDGRRVEAGYAILQPRVSFLYRTGFRSWFARLFAGSAGVDPYSSASSDTSMDLFARGSFTGKGLYDIDAFAATAGDALPANAILSHDLIESNFARCALASDIEVYDEFPAKYHAYARRDHRWIRGDWQLLPWLRRRIPTRTGARLLNVLPALERWKIVDNLRRSLVAPAAVLLLILAWTVLPGPAWAWTLFALLPWMLPSAMLTLETLMGLRYRDAWRGLSSIIRFNFANTLGQAGLQIAFLADQAWVTLDAIGRTLYRLFVSRKHLLEWESAAASEARLGERPRHFVRSMWPALVIAVITAALIIMTAPERLLIAAPLLLAWLASPAIAFLVSKPRSIIETPLTAAEDAELRRVAKLTWSFFEAHVGEADNWLPPDNFQESPLGVVAHRTSPTNIGLYLLSTLAAHDLKYIDTRQMADRLRRAFDSLDKLEYHRGHFYNWYQTDTLKTLHPAYVSTVDSGNLLACFIALKHGLHEVAATLTDDTAVELTTLAGRAEVFAAGMHFGFLYNPQRELFSIGFNASTNRLDANHYDLLASEACIASFLAVARGEVPRKHWFQLGRLVVNAAGETGLASWGGTMFEFLMPRLLLPTSPGVLLDRVQRTAVSRQIEHGREQGKPWGVSESGFALLDAGKIYQYQSFGVPGLGLKRGLDRDRVIAPYATMLAVDIDATAAVKNFAALKKAGGEGQFGFYEAIDYDPERAQTDGSPTVVQSYMAHHQGMGFLAIVNRLSGGLVRQWFAQEPCVRATALLLDERVPTSVEPIDPDGPTAKAAGEIATIDYPMRRRINTVQTPTPRTHLLSNGRYTTMLTSAGGGYSRCGDLDVTRWRADPTADGDGQFIYVRDRASGATWATGFHPNSVIPGDYEVTFSIDKAEFRRADGDLLTLMEVVVVPDTDIEVRRVTITNTGTRSRMLDLTSYAEIVLAPHAADVAHPAFGKLFVETEWLPDAQAILARRRPRSADQPPLFAVHVLATDVPGTLSYETAREVFLGRRRSTANPQMLDRNVTNLSGSIGAVLDPIAAIRRSFHLKPGESAGITFSTGVAATREEAIALAEKYHTTAAVQHAFEFAWAHARIELQGSHWKPDDVHFYQRLAGHLLYPTGPLRAAQDVLLANRLNQPSLWAFSISGDLPILLLRMHSAGGLLHLRQLLQAHAYWSSKNFAVDLVLLLEHAGGYLDELHDEVLNQIRMAGLGEKINRPGGIFPRKGFQMTEPDRTLLLAAARVVLDDRRGPVAAQADFAAPPKVLPLRRPLPAAAKKFGELAPRRDLQFDNGIGGFSKDGSEYVLHVRAVPPMPWSNVIANERGGFLITDAGSGYAWASNSQSNRLTPWSNDPVSDPSGEAIYLHDEDSATLWCPTPQPVPAAGPVSVRHGIGYSVFERISEGIASELTVFVPLNDPVKISLLTLRNTDTHVRRLEIVYYVEWVLGTVREATVAHIVTRIDNETGAIFAGNRFNPDFAHHIAFADTDLRPRTVTGDRSEFLGRNGSMARPASFGRETLSGAVGAGHDACAALRGSITLAAGETRTVVFVLGQATDPPAARRMIRDYRTPAAAKAALKAVKERWTAITDTVQVQTPDAALNLLLNRWLLYQTLSCRLWGRSAFYQSGGAYGFRDQLQDVCALVHAAPAEARTHILRAARRQFVDGDVQHWWHEPAGNGVRTRFSDDFLWLIYTTAVYVDATGDEAVLQEMLPFLEAPILHTGQHEVYGIPSVSEQTASLFEHCDRAFQRGWQRGEHGLPLMGTGDWNDGMNTVGSEGRGESVWVGWFQLVVGEQFAKLAERVGDASSAIRARNQSEELRKAIEENAWDGEWYRRAYFDDGTPLGSASNDECQIDSIAQSWAVIAGGDRDRAVMAMDSVCAQLLKPEDRLILLFAPPFDDGPLRPGYIKGYLPGVRENGGQYTHAAAWVIKALAELGRGDAAHAALAVINPIAMPPAQYRGEPYVVAGDVYSRPPHVGRAGWTWYTGSSAWLYRIGLEDLLGLRRSGNRLMFDPCIPAAWPGFRMSYRFGGTLYKIEIVNPHGVERGVATVTLDGIVQDARSIECIDDGHEHAIRVQLGPANPGAVTARA